MPGFVPICRTLPGIALDCGKVDKIVDKLKCDKNVTFGLKF